MTDPTKKEDEGENEEQAVEKQERQRNRRFGIAMLVVVAVVIVLIAVGLSVGLTLGNHDTPSTLSTVVPQGDDSSGGDSTSPVQQETPQMYRAVGRALPVTVNALSKDALEGYASKTELEQDIETLLRFVVNSYIENQIRYGYRGGEYPVFVGGAAEEDMPVDTVSDTVSGGNAAAAGPSASEVSDFGTNVQEQGVDEADQLKSDGSYVYAAYGDMLVVWNATSGELVSNYTLPAIQMNSTDSPGIIIEPGVASDIMIDPYWMPKPYIQSLLIKDTKIVAFVGGYGNQVLEEKGETSMCYDAYGTRIMVFDMNLNLLAEKDVHGYYQDARMIGDDIHVVSNCNLNFWPVTMGLDLYLPEFQNMTDNQYRTAAALKAEGYIADAKGILLDDIARDGMPKMPRMTLMQSVLGNDTNTVIEAIYDNGYLQNFVHLHSFSLSNIGAGELSWNHAGTFSPWASQHTYMMDGHLVLAVESWNYNPAANGTTQTTYLFGYRVSGDTLEPAWITNIPGYILNSYALSVYNGYLRVASTTEFVYYDSDWGDGGFIPVSEPIPVEPNGGIGNSQVDNSTDSAVNSTDGVRPSIDMSVAWPQPSFVTENQILILELPTTEGGELKLVSEIGGLGKEGERITAVRYFGDIAYLVTFLQTDPLYAISLDPNNPGVLGDLNITGFSSYLQLIDNTLLVGVGMEATSDGVTVGLQVTLFDAKDPTNLQVLARANVEEDLAARADAWSWSDATFDYKAFRWVSLGVEVGIVIIPVTISSTVPSQNFDGFLVYDVSRQNGISVRTVVPHQEGEGFFGCYYNAYLSTRSYVIDGALMTTKGHNVISTDLDTGARLWELEMMKPVNDAYCVFW